MNRFLTHGVLLFYTLVHGVNGDGPLQPYILKKTCMLIPDSGPCRANLSMYYFEPNKKTCLTFHWGGCQGNGNRFDTESECYGYCLSTPETRRNKPRYCNLAFDYGYCFGAEQRWYYDRMWKVCKHTIFSGCGGNRNNFQTRAQCARSCRFGSDGGWGPGGGGDGSGGGGDFTNQTIINPGGITKTTACFKPRHSTTTSTTTTQIPDYGSSESSPSTADTTIDTTDTTIATDTTITTETTNTTDTTTTTVRKMPHLKKNRSSH